MLFVQVQGLNSPAFTNVQSDTKFSHVRTPWRSHRMGLLSDWAFRPKARTSREKCDEKYLFRMHDNVFLRDIVLCRRFLSFHTHPRTNLRRPWTRLFLQITISKLWHKFLVEVVCIPSLCFVFFLSSKTTTTTHFTMSAAVSPLQAFMKANIQSVGKSKQINIVCDTALGHGVSYSVCSFDGMTEQMIVDEMGCFEAPWSKWTLPRVNIPGRKPTVSDKRSARWMNGASLGFPAGGPAGAATAQQHHQMNPPSSYKRMANMMTSPRTLFRHNRSLPTRPERRESCDQQTLNGQIVLADPDTVFTAATTRDAMKESKKRGSSSSPIMMPNGWSNPSSSTGSGRRRKHNRPEPSSDSDSSPPSLRGGGKSASASSSSSSNERSGKALGVPSYAMALLNVQQKYASGASRRPGFFASVKPPSFPQRSNSKEGSSTR